MIASRISSLKNELIDPPVDFADQAESAKNPPFEKTLSQIYTAYQARLRQANAVDFDDLIGLTVTMLRENPAIREGYRRRFRHLMVDEYQDTNPPAQYALVRELTGDDPTADLTVVGDSDQSIYAFRGATIRNIVEFEQDFPLGAHHRARAELPLHPEHPQRGQRLIEGNEGRRRKSLWTDQGEGGSRSRCTSRTMSRRRHATSAARSTRWSTTDAVPATSRSSTVPTRSPARSRIS